MVLAARGARNLDGGEETIADRGLIAALRRRARMVHLKAGLAALALTGLILALP